MYSYGKNFWILCWSVFFFMTSFNLIIPELNEFITMLGGADKKGLIIVLFSVSALISRPFSGKLADTIGRKRVMLMGIIVSILVCLLYPLSVSVAFFLTLRFLHGFGAGFYPTGATALVTDLLPASQRGKGMGIWGTFISLGIGAGQGLGSPISQHFGLSNLFLTAAGTTVLSLVLLHFVRETLADKQRYSGSLLRVKAADFFEPNVLPAAIVMFLSASCSGIIFVLTPEISKFLNIENKGWFFIFYMITTIGVRLFLSSLSDKIGRRKALLLAMCFLIFSMLLIGFAHDLLSYTLASVCFGVATGISSPTLFAWTADLSHPERRGVGSGTMFIALELGVMFGATSTLLTYQNSMTSIFYGFATGATLALIAIVYLIWHLKRRTSSF